jgi:hypothetical protein
MSNFSELQQGNIYLIKGTLNQFAYEIGKLDNVNIIIDPDWEDIQQTISSNSIFGEHTYYAINGDKKIPTSLYIGDNKCYTLFILVSNFLGELTDHKKLFKSCHAPYYSLDILSKDYMLERDLNLDLIGEIKHYHNLNPKLEIERDTLGSYRKEEEEVDIAYTLILGNIDFWDKSNRHLFYRYLLSNNSCKYNYVPLNKPPYNLPAALWIIFIIYCKEKTRVYNLYPEYLLKIFSVWVYLTTNYYKTGSYGGLTSFINKRDKKKYYAFATNENALKGLRNIIKKC